MSYGTWPVSSMSREERIIILIPAKGSSVRLPRKNISLLGGKTLLAWAVNVAESTNLADQIVVSSEDPEVVLEAEKLGHRPPFIRPKELSRNPAGIEEVAIHTLDEMESKGEAFDTLIILPPTSPFRTPEDVHACYKLFKANDRAIVLSVSEYSHMPFAALLQDDRGKVTPAFPEYFGRKSQDVPKTYRPNGAVHVLDVPSFRATGSYLEQPLYSYVMPRERSIDIDTYDDLVEAQFIFSNLSQKFD